MSDVEVRIHCHGVTLPTFGLWQLQGHLGEVEVIPLRRFSEKSEAVIRVAPGRHVLELTAVGVRRLPRRVEIDIADESGQVVDVRVSWMWGWLAKPRVAVRRAG